MCEYHEVVNLMTHTGNKMVDARFLRHKSRNEQWHGNYDADYCC